MHDGIDKVNKLLHCEVYKMGAKCFLELCFATAEGSTGNLMVVLTQ